MFTVNEVANIAHTTVKTLHYYHKIGLLIPEHTTDAGYRLYGEKDLERLQQILFYKELDFTLKEIKELLDEKNNRDNILIEQKYLLEQKIERLKTKPDEGPIEVITRLVDYYNEDDNLTDEGEEDVRIGLLEFERGETISHKELGRQLGLI